MDNIKFNDMKVGGQYNTVALLQAVTEKVAKNGKPFVELELSDGEVVIIARQFDCCESELIINGIPEAVVLNAIDMIDSRMNIFSKAYTEIDSGEMSGNIYALGNCSVYKPVAPKQM